MTKKITALLVAVILLIGAMPAIAADDSLISPYASSYLDGCFITTTPEGNRKITVDYTVYGTGEMTELGATKVEIQRYNGNDWVYYTTLTGASTENDVSHSDTVTFYGTVGVKYRAMVYAYAKDNTGSDSRVYDGFGVYCK